MNGFVIIVEPEEANRERIYALLESTERKFQYELVVTAEQAITLAESRKPDVFVADMNMPIISAEELFTTVKMLSPETIPIVMTDVDDARKLINFMNECKMYKVIMKPCRLAEDIVKPVEAALEYKQMQETVQQELSDANMGFFSTKRDYTRMKQTWQKNIEDYERIQHVFADLLTSNLKFGSLSENEQQLLEEWFQYETKQYIKTILNSSGNYEECVAELKREGNEESLGYFFEMKNMTKETIHPELMKKISYIMQLMIHICKKLLYTYKIRVLIESTEKAYILRCCCSLEKELSAPDAEKMFRITDAKMREILKRAAEKGVDAFGYKTVIIPKGKDILVNIAVTK